MTGHLDRYVLADGAWRIETRRLDVVWQQELPLTMS